MLGSDWTARKELETSSPQTWWSFRKRWTNEAAWSTV